MHGWLDLSARGRIQVTGEDRKRLVHAMTTNHIEALEPGQSCEAFFLTAQGKILADCGVLCQPAYLLIDVEPEVREKIYQHLDRFIIADDAYLEDVTQTTCEIALFDGAPPPQPPAFERWGIPHWVVPAAERDSLIASFSGSPQLTTADFRLWRLEHGIPRYGEDITELNLVQETQRLNAVHFSKGCYLGQEIVERVRSRGLVHRLLVPLRIEGTTVPGPGAEVLYSGQKAGSVTSAIYSQRESAVRALAYVRTDFLRPGVSLEVGGAPAQVVQQG